MRTTIGRAARNFVGALPAVEPFAITLPIHRRKVCSC